MTSFLKALGILIAGAVIGALAVSVMGGSLGGVYEQVPHIFKDGLKIGDSYERNYIATFAPGANSVKAYCNTTNRDVIADYGSITFPTSQTASSSLNVSLFATTSTSIPATQDFAALAETKRALMQTYPVATSTTASTTNSTLAAGMSKGNGQVLVASGSCVWGYLQQNTTACSIAGAAAGLCETATSTNRGVNPVVNVHVHSLTTAATNI